MYVCMCVFVCAFVCLCVTTHVKPARDHPPLDDLKISLFLSLSFSHSLCARLCTRAHMHAARVPAWCSCVSDLPSRHTMCPGGRRLWRALLPRAHTMQCPALINLIDCMTCDYSELCCSGSWRCNASFFSKQLLGCTRGYRFAGDNAKDYEKAIGIVRYLGLHSFLGLS